MSNHLLNIAVHKLDLDALSKPNEANKLLQYHPSPLEQEQAFVCRSQSIKLRNPNRNRRTKRSGGGRSSLAYQRRPSMYSPTIKKSSSSSSSLNGTTTTTMAEKEAEVRDDHDTFNCEDDRSTVSSTNPRKERRILLRTLSSNDHEQEESKKKDVEGDIDSSKKHPNGKERSSRHESIPSQTVVRRSRSMDPGLLRGRGREDQGEDQPSPRASLRRSHSLDHGRAEKTQKKKASTRRKRYKAVPKISSISSVDTVMMEADIWIECLWFNKKTTTKRSSRRKKKTYFKSFRTQKCFKRPPDGARTVLYLQTFSDSDEDDSSSRTRTSSFGPEEDDGHDEYYSDCGDSMECLYHESYAYSMKQEFSPMKVPGEIMKFTKTSTVTAIKKPRRVRKRGLRAFIRFFVKSTRASF